MRLADGEFNEQFEERSTRITGTLLLGVQRSGIQDGSLSISALLPEGWEDGETCLRVVTANGRYEVSATYVLDQEAEGAGRSQRWFAYPFPTSMSDWLLQQGTDEIAALATRGDCSDDLTAIPERVVVAAWGGVTGGPVDLLVNSLGASQVYLYVGDNSGAIACEPVLGEILTAYDTVCTVEEEYIRGGEINMRLLRVENRQPGRPVEFVLTLPTD
jgi:hypothetical protein